jgi:hypothetical protein
MTLRPPDRTSPDGERAARQRPSGRLVRAGRVRRLSRLVDEADAEVVDDVTVATIVALALTV